MRMTGIKRRETQRQRVMESWEGTIRVLVVFVSNNAKLSNWVDKSNGSSFRRSNSITIRARSFFFPGRWRIAFSFFGGGYFCLPFQIWNGGHLSSANPNSYVFHATDFFFFSNGVLAVGFKQMRALNNYKRILRSYNQCAKFGLQVPPKIVFNRINRFYSDHYQHLFEALVVTKIERAVIWTDGHLSKNLN